MPKYNCSSKVSLFVVNIVAADMSMCGNLNSLCINCIADREYFGLGERNVSTGPGGGAANVSDDVEADDVADDENEEQRDATVATTRPW